MKYCRLVYFGMLAWWLLWAALFYFVLGNEIAKGYTSGMDWWAVVADSCPGGVCNGREIGVQFVYRITFMLLIFHLVIGLLSIGAESSSPGVFMAIHRKGMPWKFLAQLVLWFAFTCIPSVAFKYINYITGIFAGFYVIAQFVVLMETSYRLNEHLLGGGAKSGPAIAYAVIVYLGTLAVLVVGFYYSIDAALSETLAPISLAEALGIMVTAAVLVIVCFVVTLLIETATIIASATVSLALASHACLVVCQIMHRRCMAGALCPESFITGMQSFELVLLAATAFFGAISMISVSVLFGAAKTKYSEYEGYDSGDDEETKHPSYAYYGFHVVCMALACYLTVIFSADPEMPYCLGIGTALGSLLYIWTLVAPKLLPDRDFGV